MTDYSRSSVRVKDPYMFLALNVIKEAFRDIECYYLQEGTEDEIKEGKRSIDWIRKMEGNFRLFSVVSGKPLEEFHQMCLEKLNIIKSHARQRMEQKAKERANGRTRNIVFFQED